MPHNQCNKHLYWTLSRERVTRIIDRVPVRTTHSHDRSQPALPNGFFSSMLSVVVVLFWDR